MDETKPKRRFRFGLRTLLFVVTLAAVGSWAYSIGWPWWLVYCEKCNFEQRLRQFHAGMTFADLISQLKNPFEPRGGTALPCFEGEGEYIFWVQYVWPDARYLLCVRFRDPYKVYPSRDGPLRVIDPDNASSSVQVFKLRPPPSEYLPQTEAGRNAEKNHRSFESIPNAPYVCDFLHSVYMAGKTNPGIEYELIYSDPPAKPIQ